MGRTIRLKCYYCGKEFEKPIGEYNRRIREGHTRFFCSASCAAKYGNSAKAAPAIIKKCPRCGKEFLTAAWGRRSRQYCSRECANAHRHNAEVRQKIGEGVRRKWKEDPAYAAKCGQNWTGDQAIRYFTSSGERELRQFFQTTYPSQNWTWGGRLVVDGVSISRDLYSDIVQTCIEYDGVWHFVDITGQLEDKSAKDQALEWWCQQNGYRLIRIEDEVYKEDPAFWRERIAQEVNEGDLPITVFYRLEHTQH